MTRLALTGARIFDGVAFRNDRALVIEGGRVAALVPETDLPADVERRALGGGLLVPGFVDLQVNGGGGVMLNDAPEPATLARIAAAHAGLGATTILPTLITDAASARDSAIAAVAAALAQGMPGIGGLHLEGPHIAAARKGAHPAAHVRPMDDGDLEALCDAAGVLPSLLVTLAPEIVPPERISALAAAGAIVSLGHSDCDFETAERAVAAGARKVTHLYNAMSPLGHRAPGLVGAALSNGALRAGVIADLVHVHPAALRVALAAKPGGLILVSDAMAPAGTDADGFDLQGRRVLRRENRLTLPDGTLAGADLDLPRALRNVVGLGVAVDEALTMVTSRPADLLGRGDIGRILSGGPADLCHMTEDLRLRAVWQGGRPVTLSPGL